MGGVKTMTSPQGPSGGSEQARRIGKATDGWKCISGSRAFNDVGVQLHIGHMFPINYVAVIAMF